MDYLILLHFQKHLKRSIKFKSETDTRLSPTPYSIIHHQHTKVVTNKVGTVNWTFNTDLLDDSNVQFIEEVLASDRHYIIDYSINKFIPINLLDMEYVEKSGINDKAKYNIP
jgi:hypothetical protein